MKDTQKMSWGVPPTHPKKKEKPIGATKVAQKTPKPKKEKVVEEVVEKVVEKKEVKKPAAKKATKKATPKKKSASKTKK